MSGTAWRTARVVLVCGTVVLLLSFGIRTSFGIFLQPISADLAVVLGVAAAVLHRPIDERPVGRLAPGVGSGAGAAAGAGE